MITTQTLGDWVSIGITTKNRWNDLEVTLQQICDAGLHMLPILIFDDGSDQPCPMNFSRFPLKITFKRFSDSEGLIVRRNGLVQEIQTKYYLPRLAQTY
jgi:hypothetical protein